MTALKARKTDPLDVALSSFYPKPATRLDAFHVAFPNRATSVEIATADLSQPLGLLTSLLKTVLGYGCPLEPADVDAVTAGAQYDCDLDAYYDDGTTEPVRQCQTNMTGPCFLFTADPANCPDPRSARVSLRGFPTRWTPAVRGQCVVIGQN